ncbi:hypothetical protein K788_0001490 (plasmid) [Paraburkholderia caribensis MBA4]|uniref:Uncharacterized protein n=1 Tax=Paraburkholderia caribensis MBA4 TaxID=1323664 RepID=A0A0P0RN78_9BURK|nr:hypothetical protein [Paraburkholderia caribensis]ALL70161.1 hypothetical protein K788_0001490 [Paraburkholderia caribensis MBA4]
MIGFALGTIRVLLLVPCLGETAAVSLEAPFMLAASWNLSRWSAKRHDVLTDTADACIDASDSPQIATGYVTHLAFYLSKVSLQSFRSLD